METKPLLIFKIRDENIHKNEVDYLKSVLENKYSEYNIIVVYRQEQGCFYEISTQIILFKNDKNYNETIRKIKNNIITDSEFINLFCEIFDLKKNND